MEESPSFAQQQAALPRSEQGLQQQCREQPFIHPADRNVLSSISYPQFATVEWRPDLGSGRRPPVISTIYRVDISDRFSENLAGLRQAAGMSQEELAFRASIHRTQISLMESGGRLPRLDTLVKLAGALGVPIETLLKGIVWEPSVTKIGHFKVADPQ